MAYDRLSIALIAIVTNIMSAPLNAQVLVGAEYFVDFDPGLGDGVVLSEDFASDLMSLDLSGLEIGQHNVCIRFRDSWGHWSDSYCESVFVTQSFSNGSTPLLTTGEYFVDTDAGTGSGVDFLSTSSEAVEVIAQLALSDLEVGRHDVCVRFRDDQNRWSDSYCESVFVTESFQNGSNPLLTTGEYFVDMDPGVGSGVDFLSTSSDAAEVVGQLALSDLEVGRHDVCVRFRDDQNRWSDSYCESVFIDIKDDNGLHPQLVQWEYFWGDSDPGLAQAIAESSELPVDTLLFDQTLALNGLEPGLHLLSHRFRDDRGYWSMTQTDTVRVCDAAAAPAISDDFVAVCEGSELSLSVDIEEGLNYEWTSPNGENFIGPTLSVLGPVSGVYQVRGYFEDGCPTLPAQTMVEVETSPNLDGGIIVSPTACPLTDSILASVEGDSGWNYEWSASSGQWETQGVTYQWVAEFLTSGTVELEVTASNDCGSVTSEMAVIELICDTQGCPEDLDGDGWIVIGDLLLLLSNFGCQSDGCSADITGDGTTTIEDLLAILSSFGNSCN
jgi:hypothetical protein